jgi:hypothetical protein
MSTQYSAINGQTLSDICMNTYGSMNYYYKLLQDNSIDSADVLPVTGQIFQWDETLIIDTNIQKTISLNNIKFATAP